VTPAPDNVPISEQDSRIAKSLLTLDLNYKTEARFKRMQEPAQAVVSRRLARLFLFFGKVMREGG
jgi:hypothetical protein